ncbi:cellulose biosynthesis cyclic di-GMP-binding regulatory protein BcsB [Paenibacillus sp. P25]|nr:cellulose biosynthesis cyclic di-GMP-binding regulatory protein BcsB [Paenibacillus sp. P25]
MMLLRKWMMAGLLSATLLSAGMPAAGVWAEETGASEAAPSGGQPDATVQAPGAPNPAAVQAENLPIFAGDKVIQGVTNREDSYFEISKSRKVMPGSYIELQFGHSPTPLAKKSTLTVMLDDVPLGSVFLDEKNLEGAKWKLDLSAFPFKEGFHKLSMITHMEVSDNLCDDENNTANWMIFSKSSLIHLNFAKGYNTADLAYYPAPFLEKGSLRPLVAAFVLPADPDEAELSALTSMSQFIASQVPGNRLNFQVYREVDLTDQAVQGKHLIWIGESGKWKTYGKTVEDQIRKNHEAQGEQGFIALSASPWNSALSELFISGTAADLTHAAAILTNEGYYSQLSGDFIPVPKELAALAQQPAAADQSRGNNKFVTLADMGYGNLTVESPLVGGAHINYNVPSGWKISGGAKLKLLFKHSKTLNFAQSVMSVKVNGQPVDSRKLNEETSEAGSLELNLTNDMIGDSGVIAIDISFQFSSDTGKAACTGNSQIGNWAVINSSSSLSFEVAPKGSMDLSDLPSPATVQSGWSNAALVVPAQPTAEELSTLATMIGTYGKSMKTQDGLTVVSASRNDLGQVLKDKNILYIGAAGKMPEFLGSAKEGLVRYQQNEIVPASKDIELLPALRKQAAWLEVMKSPLNSSLGAVVISATEPQKPPLVAAVMSDPDKASKIAGKLTVIDSRQQTHVFQTAAPVQTKTGAKQLGSLFSVAGTTVLNRLLFIGGFIGLLLVLGLILWFTRYKRK